MAIYKNESNHIYSINGKDVDLSFSNKIVITKKVDCCDIIEVTIPCKDQNIKVDGARLYIEHKNRIYIFVDVECIEEV